VIEKVYISKLELVTNMIWFEQ